MRRGTSGWVFSTWFAFVASMASVFGQEASATQPETLRLEIVGASVSAGFVDGVLTGGDPSNRTVSLGTLVKRWVQSTEAKVNSRADEMMFLAAERSGAQQLERAKKQQPTVLLAVDFLFWFAYGDIQTEGTSEGDARLARLRHGLGLLDGMPCAMLISDLPDMRGASRRMLRPSMIPSPDDLKALNAEIRTWASTRPRVRVFELAATVARLKDQGVALQCGDHEVPSGPGALLQKDLLHANRLGMAYLGHCLQPVVRDLVPEALRKELPEVTFLQFCDFAGATGELEDLAAAAEDAKAKADAEKADSKKGEADGGNGKKEGAKE